MAAFIPRQCFSFPASIPKTYFLGHHLAGVRKMKTLLPSVSLVLECRDFRVPLSTHNPAIEAAVGGRERLIVYTKSDLGSNSPYAKRALRDLHGEDNVFFWTEHRPAATTALLDRLKEIAERHDSLTGLRALVVGMPNVGKSTLLNKLRELGTPSKTKKAARTGDQAGVTRKVSTAVRVVPSAENGGTGDGIFVIDTPGVFQAFVDDAETMLKVALVRGIKKGLVPDEILTDYLLYLMNRWDPKLYHKYCLPTNDVNVFLKAVAKRHGKLKKAGVPDLQGAAAAVLTIWRRGGFGKYVLDELGPEDIRAHQQLLLQPSMSLNQAKKAQKELRKTSAAGD